MLEWSRNWARGAMLAIATAAMPAGAETARDLLTHASFADATKAAALAHVGQARDAAQEVLRRSPGDGEARLMQATALGYSAKLSGSRGDAVAARQQFEALVARDPRDPEAQVALGAWHVGAVYRLGGFVGRAALGAQKKVGLAALDRAVALGGDHAFYPGLAALLRLELDPADPRGAQLAEVALRAGGATPLDRLMQRAAAAVLVPVRAGDRGAVKALASRLLPFGRFD